MVDFSYEKAWLLASEIIIASSKQTTTPVLYFKNSFIALNI